MATASGRIAKGDRAAWLPVANFEDRYEVSDHGEVRSLYFDPPRALKPFTDKDGYPVIALWKKRKRRAVNLHRLVAEAFHAEQRNVLHNEVAHLDGDRTNCRADNLKWVSKVENHFHMRAHGTHPSGEAHGNAKLTADLVREIRASSESHRRIAAKCGLSYYTVRDLRQRRSWRHV
jgi:hypothetical protein